MAYLYKFTILKIQYFYYNSAGYRSALMVVAVKSDGETLQEVEQHLRSFGVIAVGGYGTVFFIALR